MKALSYRVPMKQDSFIRVAIHQLPHFYDRLHYHEQWQITKIIKGEGSLFAGNGIHRFQAGDLFILGSGLSHFFKNDAVYYTKDSPGVESISLFFSDNIIQSIFLKIPELRKMALLFEQAIYGVQFKDKKKTPITAQLSQLKKLNGFEKFNAFLAIIHQLSSLKKKKMLSIPPYERMEAEESAWLSSVIHYSMENYKKNIKVQEVANVANMSVSTFCRSFKLHTRKSYIEFLNELRIQYACKLLKQKHNAISQVAHQVGFSNLSNFNRRFKYIVGKTPGKYVKEWA